MAKRVADAQIQRETYDSNESDDDVTPSTKVASSAVMNRRKIAMPKRRMAFK
nr:Chain C, NUCLEOPORIN NUP2 [Saccharomyces cerevisiae]1UN0_D Chain D, NUCLEOPORIN NUP2 [Saccharomyces cerevisiae]2C1T_C Chain C, NUCLEOPORIN NUP2 [Saccharomyces cerevisiae]2C1T_D Chain D, NUCLEOPORIN NUP2 [Saccharomyces cerevisiae]